MAVAPHGSSKFQLVDKQPKGWMIKMTFPSGRQKPFFKTIKQIIVRFCYDSRVSNIINSSIITTDYKVSFLSSRVH